MSVIERTAADITSSGVARSGEVLTEEALALVAALHRAFDERRHDLLTARLERQKAYDGGARPDFRPDTAAIRDGDWRIGGIPADLTDRRVEITGPTNAKMVINALNSGAKVFMADFEDATSPRWDELLRGQLNLKDRWAGTLAFTDSGSGKAYAIGADPAVLIVRPRGLHLDEVHCRVDGAPVSGAFFDAALCLVHNARAALAAGSGPYFYLSKLESMEEAALWSDVLSTCEDALGLERGTIKVTVLIETLPAAFEMDEILHALKEHVVGLNCGRWDYIFSAIKRIGRSPDWLTPDRSAMTMDRAFLAAYSLRLVATCHRRGAFAMGGMAAFIPVKGDEAANAVAFAKVRADKQREVANGHDGTWVAHPALVPVAMEAFDKVDRNQLDVMPPSIPGREAMLSLHEGPRTEAGARENIRVAIQYIAAWLGGRGAVPLYNLMEDAATAEICRAQLWQWLRFESPFDDDVRFSRDLFEHWHQEEVLALGDAPHVAEAARLLYRLVTDDAFEEFLTLPAYPMLDRG
ncbi:malate synthase A [Sphingomonas sp. LY29]|uniref:malate synthase A n=1 Tax=Sphingomonas sp. LY29 TaxID=3095341 RepID=UPI002D76F99B|nr:malate synthase A [Sphingomonas sp. LY29]WRP24956.1 malate synthase A [Sphingomonas sp. LY29]